MKKIKFLKIKYITFVFSSFIFSSFFLISSAKTFKDVVSSVLVRIIKPVGPIIVGLTVAYFIVGVIRFIKSDDKGREEGKQMMFWGVVGLFVMVSVWGIVSVIQSSLSL
jgi:hypothetical protein